MANAVIRAALEGKDAEQGGELTRLHDFYGGFDVIFPSAKRPNQKPAVREPDDIVERLRLVRGYLNDEPTDLDFDSALERLDEAISGITRLRAFAEQKLADNELCPQNQGDVADAREALTKQEQG